MPWQERSAMEEKASFILEWQSGEHSFVALCRAFGISRTLGYRYLLRFVLWGVAGLKERSRAPRRVWNRTAPQMERAIVRLRTRWPRLGPLKIWQFLQERYGTRRTLPSVSTIALVLKRYNLIKKRRRVRRIRAVRPIFEAKAPNEIWSVDFKGKFRMGDGRCCCPLRAQRPYFRPFSRGTGCPDRSSVTTGSRLPAR